MPVCANCERSLPRKRPGEPGPAPTYCSHACWQAGGVPAAHPLGWKLLREWGIEDRSLLAMLREAGVRSA